MPEPAFFLGVGGTGDWVLTYLKSHLIAKHGEVPDQVRFRLLDTISPGDRENVFQAENQTYVRKTVGAGEHRERVPTIGKACMTGTEYLGLVQTDSREFYTLAEKIRGKSDETRHLDWFQAEHYLHKIPGDVFYTTSSAGQRQFGRMALFFFSQGGNSDVVSMIRTQLQEVSHIRPQGPVPVYIVASLAGGTGAGAFLDVANLVRHCANVGRIGINLIGVFVLPGAFYGIAEINNARAYAAFRELHRFQSTFGYEDPFRIKYGVNFETALSKKLFDGVYVLDADRDKNSLSQYRPEDGLFRSIAEGLELFLDPQCGHFLYQRSCNLTAKHAADQLPARNFVPAIYSSFGTWKIVLPARLYSRKFANDVVRRYIVKLTQPEFDGQPVVRLKSTNRHGEYVVKLTQPEFYGQPVVRLKSTNRHGEEVDHRNEAMNFLRDAHSFFCDFIDRLPWQPDYNTLERFSVQLDAERILNRYFSIQDREYAESTRHAATKLIRPIVSNVHDGSQSQLQAEEAGKQILTQCNHLREKYFKAGGEFDQAFEQVLARVQEEIDRALDEKLQSLLVEGASVGLGYMQALLGQLQGLLQIIQEQVLEPIGENVRKIKKTLREVENKVTDALAEMQKTGDCNSRMPFSKKHKSVAHRAQQEYIASFAAWIEREQHARILEVLSQVFSKTAEHLGFWASEVNSWAGYLCLGVQKEGVRIPGCYQTCEENIAELDGELRRIGKSHTSSIGITRWEEGMSDISTNMEGWEDKLFYETTCQSAGEPLPLWQEWLQNTTWEFNFGELPERKPVFGLKISKGEGHPPLALKRETIQQTLYDDAFGRIQGPMASTSITDYLAQKLPQDIVRLLVNQTSPMLRIGMHDVHRKAYLIYQRKPEHDGFMGDLHHELTQQPGFTPVMLTRLNNFEDPHSLIFAIMLDRIEHKGITPLRDYERDYWNQLKDSRNEALQHRQYHLFRCEQEVVHIEKDYYDQRNYNAPQPLAPVVYRLLEYPERVKQFISGLVFGMLKNHTDPQGGKTIWTLKYGIQDDEPIVLAMNDEGSDMLEAVNGFVLRGTCLRQTHRMINYNQVENEIVSMRVRVNNADPSKIVQEMINRYDEWKNKFTDDTWWNDKQATGSEWERKSLQIIFVYYVNQEIHHWRKQPF